MQKVSHKIAGVLPLITILSLGVSALCHATDAPWALEQDEGSIQLYTRPVAGSPFLEVKATALINAPIAHVAEVMGDGDSCGEWRVMCKSSTVLDTVSDTERYIYMVLDMPWPLSDRDMVIHATVDIDIAAKTVNVQLQSASSRHPEQDYVRASTRGQYQIKALDDERSELIYITHTDLGGNLSADIINPRVTSSTYEDIKRLQVLAEQ